MSILLLIVSIILWVASLVALPLRIFYAPALSYLGLLCLSFCSTGPDPWLPINNTILYSWLALTLVVMIATMLQTPAVRSSKKGMAYMMGGAIVGLALGLLGYTATTDENSLYGIMAVAVIVGIFFGFLVFSRTPDGRRFSITSGNFFNYLLAKGFPIAVTIIQIGLVFVLMIVTNLNRGLVIN